MQNSMITSFRNLLARAKEIRCKRKERAMHLCETLSLGDRRFLALVKVEDQKFLVGAAGGSISMLAQLPCPSDSQTLTWKVNDDAQFDAKECDLWK